MKVTLSHRHHGVHTPVCEAEVPGAFDDYATPKQGQTDDFDIAEAELVDALPEGFLPVAPARVLLTVGDGPCSTGQFGLALFCDWAKYFDAYVLEIERSPAEV